MIVSDLGDKIGADNENDTQYNEGNEGENQVLGRGFIVLIRIHRPPPDTYQVI